MERKIVLSAVVMAAIVSCGIHEIGGDSDDKVTGGIWGGPIAGSGGASGNMQTICYMTALDYQKGYDWRSDQARESVKCSLVVYADGVPVMKVPVGAAYETGSDPDMHRIIDGHLYTDYATDTETVIKKDGTVLFRYSGSESLVGMQLRGGDIYTLGQSRYGGGFTFRKNGEIVLSRDEGQLIGNLVNDGDSLCFAFYEQIMNAGGTVRRYYRTVGGKVSQTALREDITMVWDILASHERTIYLASMVGVPSPVMVQGEKMMTLALPAGSSMMSCRLFKVGDKVGAEGMYRLKNGNVCNAIWLEGQVLGVFPGNEAISALDIYDGGISCVMNPVAASGQGKIIRSDETYIMPEGYAVMGNDCIKMIDGILHVAMSSIKGKRPVLWKDGQTDSLKINGYISAIYTD